jgi:hypothetical protein
MSVGSKHEQRNNIADHSGDPGPYNSLQIIPS